MERVFYKHEVVRIVRAAMMDVLHDGLSELKNSEQLSAYLTGAEKPSQEISSYLTLLEREDDGGKNLL